MLHSATGHTSLGRWLALGLLLVLSQSYERSAWAQAVVGDDPSTEGTSSEENEEALWSVLGASTTATSGAVSSSASAATGSGTGAGTVSLPGGGAAIGGQSLSLPGAPGALSGMGESFAAELSTGVMSFSVPLALPTARGAVQPTLGLAYSSAGGFGIAGQGWSIGAAAISRETDRGLPSYDDRATFHPNQDRFVFGGSELVPICTVSAGACSQAIEGEVMPPWAEGWQYFRSAIEGTYYRFFWSADHRTWRAQAKDGTNLEFGLPLDASDYQGGLERNPAAPGEIFRWHLVRHYDARGGTGGNASPRPLNVVVYRHMLDGGTVYLSDIYDTPPATGASTASLSTYAHHARLRYDPRPDPLVSFRSGWRTDVRVRLAGVDITSKRFSGAATQPREVVRRYHLSYEPGTHTSLLAQVQTEGRCTQPSVEEPDGSLAPSACPRLPAIRFEYSRIDGDTAALTDSQGLAFEPFATTLRSLEQSPPHSLDEAMTELMDVNSDGLPDVVVTAPGIYAGKHAVFLNGASNDGTTATLGFSGSRSIGVTGIGGVDAGVLSFDNPNVSALDLDADGLVNLVHMPKRNTYSIFKLEPDGSDFAWVGRTITTASQQDVKIDFAGSSNRTRVVDVNADGLVDVVFASATEMQTFFSLGRYAGGEGQFGQASWTSARTAEISNEPVRRCVPWSAAAARFGDPDVQLAEMNGDGLPDIVRIRSGQILYWPGRGNGFWGTGDREDCLAGQFGQERHIEMSQAPSFGTTASGPMLLNDVNGDGLSDLVEVRRDGVDIYLNDNGVGWTGRVVLDDTPLLPPTSNRVRLTDIDGSGTPDILFGEGYNYQFIDLNGGVTPYVLQRIHNGLGRTTELDYRSSTELMLEASAFGEPWSAVAPMVSRVVTEMRALDNLDKIGRAPGVYRTEYRYRDAIYDGRSRQFRGFRQAEMRSIGDASSPTGVERSTFLLGECSAAQDGNPALECDPLAPWENNVRDTLKGLPALVETFDEQGVFLSTKHTSYQVQQLYNGADGRRVTRALANVQDTFLYDTSSFDFVGETLVMPEVEFLLDGVSGAESRPVPIQAQAGRSRLRVRLNQDQFGNVTSSAKDGCIEGCPGGIDESISVAAEFARPEADLSGWLWREVGSYVTGSVHGERRGELRSTYDASGDRVKVEALLSGSLPLLRSHELGAQLAPTPANASAGVTTPIWITLSSAVRDSFGNVTAQQGGRGRCTSRDYDDAYASLIVSETTLVGSAGANGCGTRALTTSAVYDRGIEAVTSIVDATAQPAAYTYDAFGTLTSTTLADPENPGTLAPFPASVYEYVFPSDPLSQPYSRMVRRTRDGVDSSSSSYLEEVVLADGMGRVLFKLRPADPEAGDGGSFIVAGGVEYDAKGAIRRSYEPFYFSGTWDQLELGLTPTTPSTLTEHDAFGRTSGVIAQDGVRKSQARFHGLSNDLYDAADLAPGQHQGTFATKISDGHGRDVATIARVREDGELREIQNLAEYLPTGEVIRVTQRMPGEPDVVRWLRYDSLGRRVLNVEPNTSADFVANDPGDVATLRAWRYAYNDAGDLVATSDARGCGVNYHYDAAGRLVGKDYSPCLAHQPPYSEPDLQNGAGLEAFYRYDAADPAAADAQDADGNALTIDAGLLRGRVTSIADRGSFVVSSYDALGRTIATGIKLAKPGPSPADPADRYAPRWYVSRFVLDVMGRPLSSSTGAPIPELKAADGSSELRVSYTRGGAVKQVSSSYGMLVGRIERRANGQVERTVYGDGAHTERVYGYDILNRTHTVQTFRAPPEIWSSPMAGYTSPLQDDTGQLSLEDYEFEYDDADNITSIADFRIAAEWPNFAKPVTRHYEYDDLYRVTRVTQSYDGAAAWQSPFQAELSDSSRQPKPSPHVAFASRIQEQTYRYDFLGNSTESDDDADGFFDRSLGETVHGSELAGPHQLRSASNRLSGSARQGDLEASYDAAGNLDALVVRRDGPCLPSASSCWQRFAYEWDEIGQLSRARRWDLRSGAVNELTQHGYLEQVPPARAPDVELRYAYNDGGQRVIKTTTLPDSSQAHTAYPLATLELRGTTFEGDGPSADYVLTASTTSLRVSAEGVTARILYSEQDVPTLSSGRQHVFLQFADQVGSTGFSIDHATGELVQFTTYQGYGGSESDYRPGRWAEFREPYRFTGHEEDIEVGLIYFGARYYSAALGRWLSADIVTIHNLGSDSNPYAYAYGRPIMAVDPDGNEPILTAIAVGIIVGAVLGATTSYIVQSASDRPVKWGWDGVLGAGVAGGIGGAFGGGIGALGTGFWVGLGAGAAGGWTGGTAGAAFAGASDGQILKAGLIGMISGGIGGGVGASAAGMGWAGASALSSVFGGGTHLLLRAGTGDVASAHDAGISLAAGLFSGLAAGAFFAETAQPERHVDPRSRALANKLTKTLGSATESDRQVVIREVEKAPYDALKAIDDYGTTIEVCRNSVTDAYPQLKGQQPRGWPAGKTWDTVPGAYMPLQNSVVIATRNGAVPQTGDGHGSVNLVLHELAHAVDFAVGGSHSQGFLSAYKNDKQSLSTYQKQSGVAGPQEAYAESFAEYYNDLGSTPKLPHLRSYWQTQPLASVP